jgi:hypothetical protein
MRIAGPDATALRYGLHDTQLRFHTTWVATGCRIQLTSIAVPRMLRVGSGRYRSRCCNKAACASSILEIEHVTPGLNALVVPIFEGVSHALHQGMRDLVDSGNQESFDRAFLFGR